MINYDVVYLAKEALILSLVLSLPIIAVASIVGLLFSMFQALTQAQDQTLSFAIKLVFIVLTLYLTVDWIGNKIFHFDLLLFSHIT
jgi:type III secretion protein S